MMIRPGTTSRERVRAEADRAFEQVWQFRPLEHDAYLFTRFSRWLAMPPDDRLMGIYINSPELRESVFVSERALYVWTDRWRRIEYSSIRGLPVPGERRGGQLVILRDGESVWVPWLGANTDLQLYEFLCKASGIPWP